MLFRIFVIGLVVFKLACTEDDDDDDVLPFPLRKRRLFAGIIFLVLSIDLFINLILVLSIYEL